MDIKTGLFYVFAATLLFAAFRVVTARNPVHAVLFLVLAFFQASALWLILGAEFLAITLVLVYVGAVMVLFLFVVMMMDIDMQGARQNFWRNFPLAAAMAALVALEMSVILMGGFSTVDAPTGTMSALAQESNTKALGMLLYTEYLYPLEIAAVLLLVAIIAAIALTLRERKDVKHVDVAAQHRVRKADRLTVLSMPVTLKEPEPTAVEKESA